jgi:hypothetical protein
VQRNGELYEYLTDEEKDVEQEIKNTEVESSDVAAELEKIVFDHVIKHRKIRYDASSKMARTTRSPESSMTDCTGASTSWPSMSSVRSMKTQKMSHAAHAQAMGGTNCLYLCQQMSA